MRKGVILVTRSPRNSVRRSHLSIWIVVFVGLAAVLASALLVGGARSASQPQGLIAFKRSDGIYLMRPDGSHVRPLKRGRGSPVARALQPTWSPDGRRLAFAAADTIWAINADGSGLVRVVRAEEARSPTWSPDGRKIAFASYSRIWVVGTDGRDRRRLTVTNGFPVDVDWSPAGDKIAFSNFSWGGVSVMDENGGNVHRLAVEGGRWLDWSQDGRLITFTLLRGADEPQIAVMTAGGRNVRTLSEGWDPEWSPDGRKIAFVRGEGTATEIYVMNADGTHVTRLTHNRVADSFPAWQPVAEP